MMLTCDGGKSLSTLLSGKKNDSPNHALEFSSLIIRNVEDETATLDSLECKLQNSDVELPGILGMQGQSKLAPTLC